MKKYMLKSKICYILIMSEDSYVIDFNDSYLQTIFSCYPLEQANDYQKATMKEVTIDNKKYVSGNDYYSYASEPNIYIKQNKTNYGLFGSAATSSDASEVAEDVEIATESEIDIENIDDTNISTRSEIEDDRCEYSKDRRCFN